MDTQRLALLKRKLEALSYDGELDTKSAPLAEKVRIPPSRLSSDGTEKLQAGAPARFEMFQPRAPARRRRIPRKRARRRPPPLSSYTPLDELRVRTNLSFLYPPRSSWTTSWRQRIRIVR